MKKRASTPPLRVLIVDDCPDAREPLAMLLRFWGHDAATAGDGLTALELAAAHHPDVVLLDLGLPGMDGFEVARQLRQQRSVKRPFVISLSGYSGEDDRHRALKAGCDQYWVKPADPDALRQLLASHQISLIHEQVAGLELSPVPR